MVWRPKTKPKGAKANQKDQVPPELVQEAKKVLKEVAQDLKILRVEVELEKEMYSKPRRPVT